MFTLVLIVGLHIYGLSQGELVSRRAQSLSTYQIQEGLLLAGSRCVSRQSQTLRARLGRQSGPSFWKACCQQAGTYFVVMNMGLPEFWSWILVNCRQTAFLMDIIRCGSLTYLLTLANKHLEKEQGRKIIIGKAILLGDEY